LLDLPGPSDSRANAMSIEDQTMTVDSGATVPEVSFCQLRRFRDNHTRHHHRRPAGADRIR
jgi:hypothetical protein